MDDTHEVSTGEPSDGATASERPGSVMPRRAAMAGVGAIAVSGLALAGCQVEDGGNGGGGGGNGDGDGGDGDGGNGDGGNGDGSGESIANTDEIPVGGGVVFDDEGVVITQPTEGEFKGFSATCTHQGCTVAGVADGTINCSCHGSKFSIEDASVVNGPAERPLDERALSVNGNSLTLG
ncbi:Rieske [2Fe-2S] domain-containing protein [Haloechinothrix alba]|uniref:Cytochrome bc1 complex Rieske iron-sulfur subunit n=1 Tax=Haloechinothrix alba TaxID=664784 RepID=A0A238WNP0_9PSEU|nr:Rieske (2Fe-2S) protein [Haloechinothrix alba]SNR48011.1 Rieske [2Fe-2S] domain-containing protein [Haloechinothrix alba]